MDCLTETPFPTEWSYVAEGGKHAIFRYSGTDCRFYFYILRVVKRDLVMAASSYRTKTPGGMSTDASPLLLPSTSTTCKIVEYKQESASQKFQRRIVQPLLGRCYIDIGREMNLPAYHCSLLYYHTLASGLIPPSRLSSWQIDIRDEPGAAIYSTLQESVRVSLLRDHKQLPPHPRLYTADSAVISVEIKPKAGYVTSSPLVLPSNRCKYFRTRFSLQQELMQMGHIQKGWQSHGMSKEGYGEQLRPGGGDSETNHKATFTPSDYSPLDLFSGNIVQIRKALVELGCNMQNNFRVFCDGIQYGGEHEVPSDGDCRIILNDLFHHLGNNDDDNHVQNPQMTDARSTLLDVTISIVTTVLSRESRMLSSMLAVQQLDVIDGDGATMIYDRLVHLCGSNLEAEKLLDEASITPAREFATAAKRAPTTEIPNTIIASPYAFPECEFLNEILGEIHQFQSCFRERKQVDKLDASHIKCINCVNGLSKEACVYLLQNWLLSLALCDVSFFVTFQLLGRHQSRSCNDSDERQCLDVNEECQTSDHGGIVLHSLWDDSPAVPVHYEVKVVDCDPKPARKLRDRMNVESKFRFVQNY
ncbi:hypothetical protein ACHAXA_010848 [Cyclostephanos tholiformis]|uniref:Inositol-pentakisphosphate 2-kinase n=1 Tax=Cyclostephanos tholiformis TaxID=382380 RepID=A0ABD3SDB2_9STRA